MPWFTSTRIQIAAAFSSAEGSHAFEPFVNDVARSITDPEKNISVWKRLQARRIEMAHTAKEKDEIEKQQNLTIEALGSGSDYTAFLDFLGISNIALAYGGEAGGGVYHSIYDDFYWYTHFGDPTSSMGRRKPRRWAPPSCGWRMPISCLTTSPRFRRR